MNKYLEVAKEITENHYIVGVRSLAEDESYEVGDYCRDSYEWDVENDCSAYYTTGETANGTCATYIETAYDEKELAELIAKAVEENARIYGGKQVLIAGKQINNDGMFDPGEVRIVNAKVIMII